MRIEGEKLNIAHTSGSSGEREDREKGGVERKESERYNRFLEAIQRPDLKEVMRPETPYAYWTMEIYRHDIQGQGGLGMLASDTLETAKHDSIPMTFITPLYTKERRQALNNFQQELQEVRVTPEERGFKKIDTTEIHTIIYGNTTPTKLSVYEKQEGSVRLLTITEENFGEQYQGANNSDHRLYQEVALGMGGFKAVQKMGIRPSMNQQLNEAPTVFSALARLDEKMKEVRNFPEAFKAIKEKTMYTNHTLEQAAEAEFSMDQFERFVMPNIENAEIKEWLRGKINGKGGRIKLSTLAIELSGVRNGVSLLHAQEASRAYKDYNGKSVAFEGITNGIAMERWGNPELLAYYRESGVLDEFNLPTKDFKAKLEALDPQKLQAIKARARLRARETFATRTNQYGEAVNIPPDATLFDWARRIAAYKRPGMLFARPEELAKILEENNSYLVMAGKAHPEDVVMQRELMMILKVIDRNPILKKRVHFIENYDEVVAHALAEGADVSINTPTVRDIQGKRISTEACGTSWEKKVLGNAILVSGNDGGVADPSLRAEREGKAETHQPSFLEISGTTYEEEVTSLYQQMREASRKLKGKEREEFLKKQIATYLPIISGSRMVGDYFNLAFPKDKERITKKAA